MGRRKYNRHVTLGTFTVVQLTKNQYMTIDTADLTWTLAQCSWIAQYDKGIKGYYVRGSIGGKLQLYTRRLLNVTDPLLKVDHINRNSLDNRRQNLRIATNKQNAENSKKRVSNTSGTRGVYRNKNGSKIYWCATVYTNGKPVLRKQFPYTDQGYTDAAQLVIETRNKVFTHNNVDRGAV